MKKLVTILMMVVITLMVNVASAYTAMDFVSKDECLETMGYETVELSRETMMKFVKEEDYDGFYKYIFETIGLSDVEDMMVLSAEDDQVWPAVGFVYNKITDGGKPMMEREILRIYYLELI